jgi:hypothetical protein
MYKSSHYHMTSCGHSPLKREGAERRRAKIHSEINNFIELLGGRSIEANLKAEREGKRLMQAGAKADVKTVGGVKHSDIIEDGTS